MHTEIGFACLLQSKLKYAYKITKDNYFRYAILQIIKSYFFRQRLFLDYIVLITADNIMCVKFC